MMKSVAATLVLALYALILPLHVGADDLVTYDAPHYDPGSGYTCTTCHTPNLTLGSTGYNNICLTCHRYGDPRAGNMPFTLADAANPFKNSTTSVINNMYQLSHSWDGPDTVPQAGAQPPQFVTMNADNLRSRTGNKLACVRCHDPHRNDASCAQCHTGVGGRTNFLRTDNDMDQMCMDCHRSRNVSSHLQGSHPVLINYTTEAKAKPGLFNSPPINANGANPTSSLNARLALTGNQIVCSTCHGVHYTDSRSSTIDGAAAFANLSSGDGYILRTDRRGAKMTANQPDGVNICTNCHAGKKNHNLNGQDIQCGDCHGAHVEYDPNNPTEKPNVYLIRRNVTRSGTASRIFFRFTGSQREYKNVQGTGVCQGCHTVSATDIDPPQHASNDPMVCNTCHFHNNATSSFSDGRCVACHGDSSTLVTNAHAKHVNTISGKGYSCDTCHSATVSGNSIIINATLHRDRIVEVAGSSITSFDPASKTCTTSCHAAAPPTWTGGASVVCGSCHAALSTTLNGLIATNGHSAHFSAVYGPAMAADSTNSCAICHIYTTNAAASHVNGSVDLAAGYNKVGTCSTCHKQTTNWTTGRVSCESCHSTIGGALSVIGGVTASDKTLATSAGHGKTGIAQGCTICHNSNSAHIGVPGGTKRLLGNYSSSREGAGCNNCHNDISIVTTARKQNMKVHLSSGLGSTCADCHNPHGTANSMMVNTTINSTGVSYSENGFFANTAQTGVCQVCHTSTKYFTKAGITPQTHTDSSANCLECHKHNPLTGFAFSATGACDICHGYPPAPRMTKDAVSFGIQGSWSSARFEDYSGGGGAHLVAAHIAKGAKPSEGWANCTTCHSGGEATHTRAMPMRNYVENVAVSVDPQYRFKNGTFIVYTSASLVSGGANKTGSCFNVSCHIKPTPKWSTER